MADTEDTLFPPAADNLDQSPNWLVGVIDEPARAEQAAQALLDAGFSPDNVLLLHGPEAIRRLEAKDEQRGPLGWAHKALANLVTDAANFEHAYSQEAAAGHSIINVQVAEPTGIERAAAVLQAHDAHAVKHYGEWVITDIHP